MFMFAAAAALAAPAPANSGPRPVLAVQAEASVRIISGVRLKFDSPTNEGAPPAHDSKVTADGKAQRARLIEFE
jgi:hypothetical protein